MATTSSAQLEELLLCRLGRVLNRLVSVAGCVRKMSLLQQRHMPVVWCSRTAVFVLQLWPCPEWEAA